MSPGGSGDRGIIATLGSRMPHGGQQSYVGEARVEAGASHALIVPFEHVSDGAVGSELPEAQRRLAFEPDVPTNRS